MYSGRSDEALCLVDMMESGIIGDTSHVVVAGMAGGTIVATSDKTCWAIVCDNNDEHCSATTDGDGNPVCDDAGIDSSPATTVSADGQASVASPIGALLGEHCDY